LNQPKPSRVPLKWEKSLEDKVTRSQFESRLSEAFEAVFKERWPKIHAILIRMVGDADEAEDLALETFYRLHAQFDRLGGSDRVGGWLYRVAVNLGLNALRDSRRRKKYEEQAGFEALRTPRDDNPAAAAERMEQQGQVRLILAEMKPGSAQILILRSAGLSYQELAEAVQASARSIGTLLNRAEQDFEKRYKARFGEPR